MEIGQIVDEFIEELRSVKRYSLNTLKSYSEDLNDFINFCNDNSKLMITDVSDYRLGLARECGVDFAVNTGREDLAARIRDSFGAEKADLTLECVGAGPTISQAIAVARKGTDIVVVGVFGDTPQVDMGTVQDRELRLIGTLMYQEPDWKKAIELIGSGEVKLGPLVTNHFPFADFKKAYEYIDANRERAMKVMITVQD